MDHQGIIDSIIGKLDTKDCNIKSISLMADENQLGDRLSADVTNGRRTADVIDRSITRIPMYQELKTIKIDTNKKDIELI